MKMNTVTDEESRWMQSVKNTLSDNGIASIYSEKFLLNVAINNSDIQLIQLRFLAGPHASRRTIRIIINTYHNTRMRDEFVANGWTMYGSVVYKGFDHSDNVIKEIQQLEYGINIKG